MLKRRLWMGAMSVLACAVLVCAQTITPTTSDPTLSNDPNKWLYGPELWRLPPVGVVPTASPFVQPTREPMAAPEVLTVPPAEAVVAPKPQEKPPVANAPMSLSGVLSNGEQLAIKPPVTKLWDGNINLGLDGSEGNAVSMNIHVAASLNRRTSLHALTTTVDYNKSTAKTVETVHNLMFAGRSEWLFRESSRWSWFVHETVDYDAFESYSVQDASDVGLGYRLIKNEYATLIGRLGVGFSHEYGGPEDGVYTPEGVFGLQFERQVGKRQKFLGSVEYAPGIGDILHYRIRTQAAWELLLDQDKNLSMRVGVLERYDSVPDEESRPNDLNYAMMLMWKF